jgi:hypothetical protein
MCADMCVHRRHSGIASIAIATTAPTDDGPVEYERFVRCDDASVVNAEGRAFFLGLVRFPQGRSSAHFRAACPLRIGELAGDVADGELKDTSDLRRGLSRHVYRRARKRAAERRLRNAGLLCNPAEFESICLHVRPDNRRIEFHEVA